MMRFAKMLTLVAILAAGAPLAGQGPPGAGGAPKGPQQPNLPTVAMAFRNDLDKPVVVQGSSIVNGVLRRGQPILVPPDKVNFDNNVPVGARSVSVYDGTQPSRVLARNILIRVEPGRDLRVLIRAAPNNPNQILVVPDTSK